MLVRTVQTSRVWCVLSMVYGVRLAAAARCRGGCTVFTLRALDLYFVSGSSYAHFRGDVYGFTVLSGLF